MDKGIYRRLLDNLYDGVYFIDAQRRISFWNRGAERITGYLREEVLGKSCAANILEHVDAEGNKLCTTVSCPAWLSMQDGQERDCQAFLHHRSGHRVPVRVRTSPLTDARGKTIGAVEVFSENAAEVAAHQRAERLEQLALLDPLTGLGNRRHIEAQLQRRLDEMNRYGWLFGVLFIDVDHFKRINDDHGHEAGDQVLQMVGRTLVAGVRSFDSVGRWGGEEFVVVVTNPVSDLYSVAQRLRALVEQSHLRLGDSLVRVTVSIGAEMSAPGDSVGTLIERADQLMYQSKHAGRNCISGNFAAIEASAAPC